ncbi:hypothetical protein WJX77_012559 [Trebouxia sp. C0004]
MEAAAEQGLCSPSPMWTKDASADSHNAEWISEQLIIVLEEFGPENFGAVVSDNGGGCENGRKLTKEKYPHLAIQRCMMHGFALIMGSVFGHSWAVNILKQCQKLTAAVKIIKNKVFWRDLDILTPIAKPFNQVCQAMQGHESKLADAGQYLILLARTIKALGTAEPGYRVLGRNADGRDDFKVIGREAVEMLRACKRSQNEITIMLSDFMDYKNAIPPFDAPMQQTDTIET